MTPHRFIAGLIGSTLPALAAFAQGGGGGGGGGVTSIQRPVIIAYSNQVPVFPQSPATMYMCGSARNQYPEQMSTSGGSVSNLSAVSSVGDLTHEGGSRWILDIRLTGTTGPAIQAMIATRETVGSLTDPTWYYVPGADDLNDIVLLDTSIYLPEAAKWSPRASGGVQKIAFGGWGPVGGTPTQGLFVGWVPWNDGPIGPLQDITLVATGEYGDCGGFWKWGTADTLTFARPTAGGWEIWRADTAGFPGPAPTASFTGITATGGPQPFPAMSRDGTRIAYCSGDFDARGLYIRNLTTGATIQISMPTSIVRGSLSGLEWSPDGAQMLFEARTQTSTSRFVWKCASNGSGTPKKISSTKVYNGSVIGGVLPPLVWRP